MSVRVVGTRGPGGRSGRLRRVRRGATVRRMAGSREARALDRAVRREQSLRLVRWARSPMKLVRLKRATGSKAMRARLFWGETMFVTPPEPLSTRLFLYGFHEVGMTRFVLDTVRPGMTVLDVGAHYGYYTMLASHLVGPRGGVHSFEPVPSTFKILALNTRTKRNVTANDIAAWHCETELEVQEFGVQRSMFSSVFPRRGWEEIGSAIRVPAIPLDTYVTDRGLAPGFIKIDAESAEPHVIEGLANTLERHRPVLTLELGDAVSGRSTSGRALLDTICNNYRYDAFEFSAGAIRPHSRQAQYECENIALVPRNRPND